MKPNSIFKKIIAKTASAGISISAVGALLTISSCISGKKAEDIQIIPMEESRARSIIDQAFSAQGIAMDHDTVMNFLLEEVSGGKTKHTRFSIPVDGFNDSLQIGYEYISAENEESSNLIYFRTDTGKIRILSTVDKEDSTSLVSQINEFIDTLKSAGIVK